MAVDLYPHQENALERLKNGSILWGGVGTGKSRVAAAYYIKNEAPKNVYVITTAKKRDSLDWQTEFARLGVGRTSDATIAGVLTIDSWNNIGKYRDVHGAFFIFDEQRLVGSGEWVTRFLAITKHNRWILLSATPGDTWLDYIPVFCANGFYKNRTEFKREHVVYKPYSKFPKVDRYVGVGRLVRLRNQVLVEMPYFSHTVRHSIEVKVPYDESIYKVVTKRKWDVYEQRPLKDVADLFRVIRRVVNSDSARLEVISGLLQLHPRLIVFYNFNYELESLRSLISPLSSLESQTMKISNGSEINLEELFLPGGKESEPWQIQRHANITSLDLDTSAMTTSVSNALAAEQKLLTTKTCPERTTSTTSTTTSGSIVQLAEWNGHKHEPVPTSDRWVYLVQYMAGAEGWNCVDTDAMAFYSLPYSHKMWHQAHGRIDRLNTPYTDLYYYSLVSDAPIDIAIKKCLREKRSFHESAQKWSK